MSKILNHKYHILLQNIMIAIIMYTFFYITIETFLPNMKNIPLFSIPIYKSLLIAYCYLTSNTIRNALRSAASTEDEEDLSDEERHIMTIVFRYMGIGLMYFTTQYCIVFLFFPALLEYTVFGIPFVMLLFSLTTIIICYSYGRWIYHDIDS